MGDALQLLHYQRGEAIQGVAVAAAPGLEKAGHLFAGWPGRGVGHAWNSSTKIFFALSYSFRISPSHPRVSPKGPGGESEIHNGDDTGGAGLRDDDGRNAATGGRH